MRYLAILILTFLTISSARAQDPSLPWLKGEWTNERMKSIPSYQLVFIGQHYLQGRGTDPNPALAERLFKAGVKKEPELAGHVGNIYSVYTNLISMALKWYVKGAQFGDAHSKEHVGGLMYQTALKILDLYSLSGEHKEKAAALLAP